MPTLERYRASLTELARLANVDLEALWRQAATGEVAVDLLADVLPALGDVYGSAAGTLSADYYDTLRAEAEVPGRHLARVPALPTVDRYVALARWAVVPLFSEARDATAALLRAQGGLQRIITDTGRSTIMQSSIADPAAQGWQRSASGGCGFCQMLASRGAVYSRESVDFGAHDHCRCVAVPAFDGRPRPVKPYRPSDRDVSPADRARTREWMAEHGY